MHNMHRQIGMLGAYIDRVTLDEAVLRVHEFVVTGQPHQVTTVNVDFLRLAQEDLEFRSIINRSDLAIADGMPLVWASGWLGDRLAERVTGVDLVDYCCDLAARENYGVFLLGGEEGVAADAAEVLKQRHPGLRVVGEYSPPIGEFVEDEDRKIVALIQEAKPDFLFVAFGAPKQDLWIAQHQEELQVPVAMGVGGVFNFLTGRVRRAPVWMQQKGLEWFYRVICEPRRLWRRYFVNDMPVVLRLANEAMHVRMAKMQAPSPARIVSPQLSELPPPNMSTAPVSAPGITSDTV
ncbi:MAG TPA: WecB/TagA/CpsF family glycosyltransferase [Chloroflexia bacterium]|nr:WecB/TagA/CpsF family glycosyltransferase [Chloroflexia bacterium]